MKYLFLLLFIIILFVCQAIWNKARRQLTAAQRNLDFSITANIDLTYLSLLLAGYIFIALFPHQLSLVIYFIVAIFIGIFLEIFYYQRLKKSGFPKNYLKIGITLSSITYIMTTIFGLLLLLFWY